MLTENPARYLSRRCLGTNSLDSQDGSVRLGLTTFLPRYILLIMVDNNINPLEKIYIDSEIKRLKREYIDPIQDKIDSLTATIVDMRALLVSQYINSKVNRFGFSNAVAQELTNALSTLRGRLAAKALPEDEYAKWRADIRKRLSSLRTPQQAEALTPSCW